jgi:hypothetical protein
MRYSGLVLLWWATSAQAFLNPLQPTSISTSSGRRATSLYVSIGLGPSDKDPTTTATTSTTAQPDVWKVGIDYEIPNHEEYRTSRRSKLDAQCDAWFAQLLGTHNDNDSTGALGPLAHAMLTRITTPVPLVNDVEKDRTDPAWTPYVSTRLPWTPLVPAYGLEEFAVPVPRRNAEAWRHFDVPGWMAQSYGQHVPDRMLDYKSDDPALLQEQLEQAGAWCPDDECQARLIYVNGRFVPELSKSNVLANNLSSESQQQFSDLATYLERLPDGFTDTLAAPCPNGQSMETHLSQLSRPNHNLGAATTQFAINTQQGTACFAALNTIHTGAVAYVHIPAGYGRTRNDEDVTEDETRRGKPIFIVHAVTRCGGIVNNDNDSSDGVALHPRTVIVAEADSHVSIVQMSVDVSLSDDALSKHTPKLTNGYTQIFVHERANLTHSYLQETGGMVVQGVEQSDEEWESNSQHNDTSLAPRVWEAQRPELKDTHLEAIDVHVMGDQGAYEGTVMSMGGSGRIRIALSVSLLRPGAHASVNGFSLSGGLQRTDVKTNIHHIAQGTTSQQLQKNMIGGRATGSFRGRIRVEQSAQQTDSQQLCRTILLSDRARAWAVPSLEIIADDVKCSHGATVSDLSEEEMFYLRSRGLSTQVARNMLMYAFAGDVAACVDPTVLGEVDGQSGLRKRILERMQRVVPQGSRAVQGEFQSV